MRGVQCPRLAKFLYRLLMQSRRRRLSRERFLLPHEWSRLAPILTAQPDKIRIYFTLLLLEGPRMSEARLMSRAQVDLTLGIWHKPTCKNGKRHLLPLSPQSCALLMQLPNAGLYFFPGETPHVPWSRSAVGWWWRKIRREAQLPDVQIRDLRRTCASWLTMHGENLKVVQTVLDHRSLSTTQIYARLDVATVRAALTRHAARVCQSSTGSVSLGGS